MFFKNLFILMHSLERLENRCWSWPFKNRYAVLVAANFVTSAIPKLLDASCPSHVRYETLMNVTTDFTVHNSRPLRFSKLKVNKLLTISSTPDENIEHYAIVEGPSNWSGPVQTEFSKSKLLFSSKPFNKYQYTN